MSGLSVAEREFVEYILDIDPFPPGDSRAINLHLLLELVPLLRLDQRSEFIVTLSQVASWMNMERTHLRKTLLKNFVENQDFVLAGSYKQMPGPGRPVDEALLTPDCMQRLLLMLRSKRADQIRTFYILTQQAYSEYMIEGIEKRRSCEDETFTDLRGEENQYGIEKPARNQFPVGHCLYIIELFDENMDPDMDSLDESMHFDYKIGRTNNLNRRAQEYFRLLPNFRRVYFYQMVDEPKFVESCVHMGLGSLCVDGDVFDVDPETVISALQTCLDMQDQFCREFGACEHQKFT